MKTSRCGVELSDGSPHNQEVFVSHATHFNAVLTPRARLRLAVLIVEHGWPIARAAERYDASCKTAAKWAEGYRGEGAPDVAWASSRPQSERRPPPEATPLVSKGRGPLSRGVNELIMRRGHRARSPGWCSKSSNGQER